MIQQLHARRSTERGLTLLEIIVIIAVVGFLAITLLPALSKTGNQRWIICLSNLRRIGLVFQLFANDHAQLFPMQVSTNQGGSQEYQAAEDCFRHFAALSAQLSTPRELYCPVDPVKRWAQDFSNFNNQNLSYFVGLNARPDPRSFLVGDRTLSSPGIKASEALLLTTSSVVKWAPGIHYRDGRFIGSKDYVGQAAFGDGSARRFGQVELRTSVNEMSPATNRVLLP